jgi:excisionase family DNA binding protein
VTGSQPAKLLDGGRVLLDRRGAQLVLASLELARRSWQARAGDPDTSADFAWLYEVCRIAAGSFPPATMRATFTATMPSSESRMTVGEAAQLLGHSVQAVRKQAALGRYGAARHGRVWTLSETEVRQAAGKRRRHGTEAATSVHARPALDTAEPPGNAHPLGGQDRADLG